MIQRIQSIYLLVAAIAMALVSFKIPVWSLNEEFTFTLDDTKMFILTFTAFMFSGLAIFLFKNRNLQMKLIRLSILMLMVIGVRLGILLGNDEYISSLNTWCIALLVLSFIALIMAFRGVKKDHDLVRSVDRIR